MDPVKYDELLCDIIAQLAPVFDITVSWRDEFPALPRGQAARILARVHARIAAADNRISGLRLSAAPRDNLPWAENPRPIVIVMKERPPARRLARQAARLGLEELEPRNAPSAAGFASAAVLDASIPAPLLARMTSTPAYSRSGGFHRCEAIAVLW